MLALERSRRARRGRQRDPVEDHARRVAVGGREGVAFDAQRAEAQALVEAQVADVRRRRSDEHGAGPFAAAHGRGRSTSARPTPVGAAPRSPRPPSARPRTVSRDRRSARGRRRHRRPWRRYAALVEHSLRRAGESSASANSGRSSAREPACHPIVTPPPVSSQRAGTSTTRKPSGSSNVRPCSAQYGLAGATGAVSSRSATRVMAAASPRYRTRSDSGCGVGAR